MKYRRITNEYIDNLISNSKFKRISNYIKKSINITFKCIKHNIVFSCRFASMEAKLKSGFGCHECAKEILCITNEDVDKLLIGSKFKRNGDYVPYSKNFTKVKIELICLKHNENFSCSMQQLKIKLKSGFGCKTCYKENRCKSPEYIDDKLKYTNIKRIGQYIGMNVKIEFECSVDGYRWFATPGSVLTKYVNKLKPKRKLDNAELDRRLLTRTIKRYGNMSHNRRCDFLCETCNNIWETDIYDVIRDTGCPLCKCGKNEKRVKSILEQLKFSFRHHKTFTFNDRKYHVDFYIKDKNTIIEYNGIQHYQPVKFGGISEERAIENFKKQLKRDE